MKGNNLACADRAGNIGTKIISYDNNDLIFSPYNAHWRQMRRICISELLSPRNLHSFGYIRRDEMSCLVESLRSSAVKGFIFDTFSAGTETSSTTVDWAMAELMRNPRVMAKVQEEVRWSLKGKMKVDMSNVHELKYLKVVVKETLRLHPPFPIIPRR